ncbi:hypothetical protein HDU79_006901 [Rhizoclosmatium sp. JEL0117]|nr:hypothetical protein HDU79_006901 [Rhizoclosmatium sp. JEL0117]
MVPVSSMAASSATGLRRVLNLGSGGGSANQGGGHGQQNAVVTAPNLELYFPGSGTRRASTSSIACVPTTGTGAGTGTGTGTGGSQGIVGVPLSTSAQSEPTLSLAHSHSHSAPAKQLKPILRVAVSKGGPPRHYRHSSPVRDMRPPSPLLSLGLNHAPLSRTPSARLRKDTAKRVDQDDLSHSRSSSISSIDDSSPPPSPKQVFLKRDWSRTSLKGIQFNKVLEHVCVYTPEETPLSILLAEKYSVLSSSPSGSSLSSSPAISPFPSTSSLAPNCSSPALNATELDSSNELFHLIDKPPIVPSSSSPCSSSATSPSSSSTSLNQQKHQQVPAKPNPLHVWSILSKTTPSPFSPQILAPSSNIALESICVSQSASTYTRASLLLTILVRNLHFVKRVQCVYTTDAWKTLHWTEVGIFVTALDGVDRFRVEMGVPLVDGRSSDLPPRMDSLTLSTSAPRKRSVVTVEFAVKCLLGNEGYAYEVWDNRGGQNHVVVLDRSGIPTVSTSAVAPIVTLPPPRMPTATTPTSASTFTLFNTVGTPDSAVDMSGGKPPVSGVYQYPHQQQQHQHQQHSQNSAQAKRRAAAIAARTAAAMALEAKMINEEFEWQRKQQQQQQQANGGNGVVVGGVPMVNGGGGALAGSGGITRSFVLKKPSGFGVGGGGGGVGSVGNLSPPGSISGNDV